MEMDNYVSAFAGKVQGDGAAKAFCCAGDQGDFSTEVAII
jgi:hypothetical protein